MQTIQWSSLPKYVRKALWSSDLLPKGFDFVLQVKPIDVAPLFVALNVSDSDSGVSDFESANVYEDEVLADYTEDDLRFPIIIDRRLQGLQANVADGLHRVMLAYHLGRRTLPSVDVTDMFVLAGFPIASNKSE